MNIETRRVFIPNNRTTPLKKQWPSIVNPIVQNLFLNIRYNPANRCVEIRGSESQSQLLQKAEDFVKAFSYGFEIQDAIVLLRLDDMFIDSFEVKDVKSLNRDHLSRAIGRLAGKGGRTKAVIENTSKTRVVIADTKIHILGAFKNIRIAKDAIVCLIQGSTPGKVYTKLRAIQARN
jgi:RNA-binding protein PNO1